MPLPLLLAMVIGFGLNIPTVSEALSSRDLLGRLAEVSGVVLLVGLVAFALGFGVAARIRRRGRVSRTTLSVYAWGQRGVMLLALGGFAWTMVEVDWRRVVNWGFALDRIMLVEELTLLLPFVAAQFLAWCGFYPAERALRRQTFDPGFGKYLLRRTRQSLGMILPVAIIYLLGRDLLQWEFPRNFDDPTVQTGAMAGIGGLIFLLSPAFVRLTWPTRPMPTGPMRDRLERLARRLKFRYTDLLVWDTGGDVVNAGVTGAVPWFRYVLITDAMLDQLDEHEIEAVFGHEVGHVAHRHLLYFGLFFLGTAGMMLLFGEVFERQYPLAAKLEAFFRNQTTAETVAAGFMLAIFALYFLLVFGAVSRRFERQADVFGCRAVSCGQVDCPPHFDLNAPDAPDVPVRHLCPVGIRIFANALSRVADLNGMAPRAFSWRHGSIARRIAFLETLEGRPDAEGRFQRSVVLLRWSVGIILTVASVAAIWLAQSGSPIL